MTFPNWFRVTWWALLCASLSTLLWKRWPFLESGSSSPGDLVILTLWLALLLAPVFKEITIGGLSLKQKLDEVQKKVTAELGEMRSDIRNAVDVRNVISPQFTIAPPPPDPQLPDIEARIRRVLVEELRQHGQVPSLSPAQFRTPPDVLYLLEARYSVEVALRQLAQRHDIDPERSAFVRRPPVFPRLVTALQESEVMSRETAQAIREVYSICSPAIHGEPTTSAKVDFVRSVAPQLVTTLNSL